MGGGLQRVAKLCGGITINTKNGSVKYDGNCNPIKVSKICSVCGKEFSDKGFGSVCKKCWKKC